MVRPCLALIAAALPFLLAAAAPVDQTAPEAGEELEVLAHLPPPPDPVASFPHVASMLSFHPLVEIQGRNLPEAQGDLSIRGGIFEGAGFIMGTAPLGDPQTGHYLLEQPLPPGMVTGPERLVGLDGAFRGHNATSGSLAWDWRPITTGGELGAGLGTHGLDRQHLRMARVMPVGAAEANALGLEADVAHSHGHGSVPGGEFGFLRAAGRAELGTARSRTDLFLGRQDERYAWPFLYVPEELHALMGTSGVESDSTSTLLAMASHRRTRGVLTLHADAWRRTQDSDYELDVDEPGLYDPYEHRTELTGLGLLLRKEPGGSVGGAVTALLVHDSIESTSLTHGPFTDRLQGRLGLLPEFSPGASSPVILRAGGVLDWSNREGAAVSPMAELAMAWPRNRAWLQYAESTRVPDYTALASSADQGLFRGNPDLGRERSANLEAGTSLSRGPVTLDLAVFRRWEVGMVDWVYSTAEAPLAARTASPLDMAITGVESLIRAPLSWGDLHLAHVALAKTPEYKGVEADASFYALNYPRHRLVGGGAIRPWSGLHIRGDAEYRIQEPNVLREGPDSAILSRLSVTWEPVTAPQLSITAAVDNLLDVEFQPVPGVPGGRRQAMAAATMRW